MLSKILLSISLLLAMYGSAGTCDTLTKQQCVEATYIQEIGVREATGRNDGERVEAYLRAVGFGKGHAWCAAFVSWTFQQCGVKAVKSAWSPAWFPVGKVIWSRGNKQQSVCPAAGDVFGIYFPSRKRIAHVGFVHRWGKKYVETVEGNTNEAGSREGDGVYKKRRLISQIYKVSRWAFIQQK